MTVTTHPSASDPAATKRGLSSIFDIRVLRWLFLGGLLAIRFALSTDMIGRPGLQYDETLFVNAATLRIPGDFINYSLHGIPVMVFPYIGALKSWLYAPLFSIFGTSAAVVRVPVVVLVCAGLVLAYSGVRDLVNRPVAMLAFAALCFDNSVFWLTRDDVGPSAIEFFLKCAALWCAGRFVLSRSRRWLAVLVIVLAVGVFNKLNFIWVVNAALFVSVVVVVTHWSGLRERVRDAVVWFGGLALVYAGFAAYYLGNHIGGVVSGSGGGSIGQPWYLFKGGMEYILAGTWFYTYVVAPTGPRNLVVIVVLVLFGLGTGAAAAPWKHRSLAVVAMSLTTLLIAVQNLLTAQATAGWHYVAVYPFVTIVAAYGVYAVARSLLHRSFHTYIALCCAGALALLYDGVLLSKYLSAMSSREPSNPAWSPAIYQLSNDVQQLPGTVFTADWGISNPLFALHPSTRYYELVFDLANASKPGLRAAREAVASRPGPKLFVTHADAKLVFPHVNRDLARTFGDHLYPTETINGRDGKPLFRIYRYR